MKISESLISKNQNFINYWTAESSYNDLKEFANKYILTIDDKYGTSFDHSSIFQREYNSETECLENYCVRAKIIKLATETCELYCKAILIENGKTWGELKSLGHNLLDFRGPDG